MIGKRVEMLEMVDRKPGSVLVCRCDCGNLREVYVGHFNTGKVKSCGCHVVKHGHAATGAKSREYVSYHNMIARCHKPSNKRYADYGGKGVSVCDNWRESFTAFLTDMGECPQGHTIDRIDNRLGYFPENCRWVSRSDNQRNRSMSRLWIVRGQAFTTALAAAETFGVSSHTIRAWCLGRKAEGRYYYPKSDCNTKKVYA